MMAIVQTDLITHLGIGGIFAILILREVFGFLSKSSNGDGKGKSNIQILVEELTEKVQYKDTCDQVVKRIDGEFRAIEKRDEERKENQKAQFDRIDDRLEEVKSLIRNGQD